MGRVVAVTEPPRTDRKSTRLNSSHSQISYAVFCLKKKKLVKILHIHDPRRSLLLGRSILPARFAETAIPIPLDELDVVLRETFRHRIEQVVVDILRRQVQHEMGTLLVPGPGGKSENPVRMRAGKIAVGIHHLLLDPDFFFFMMRGPPISTLFPYTTLFR